jgi:hypothetical protein
MNYALEVVLWFRKGRYPHSAEDSPVREARAKYKDDEPLSLIR